MQCDVQVLDCDCLLSTTGTPQNCSLQGSGADSRDCFCNAPSRQGCCLPRYDSTHHPKKHHIMHVSLLEEQLDSIQWFGTDECISQALIMFTGIAIHADCMVSTAISWSDLALQGLTTWCLSICTDCGCCIQAKRRWRRKWDRLTMTILTLLLHWVGHMLTAYAMTHSMRS